jgi:hypothetical protein|tara:strand:+ start:328 stop:555 length:228 start_codon:yes stop_codon:yes gene_type:complete
MKKLEIRLMNEATLLWGMFFGAIGVGYFIYGKKQKKMVSLGCGVGLFVFPYLVTGTWPIVITGSVLMIVPWVVRR